MRIFAAALLFFTTAFADEPARLVVLHTNDLHGQLRPLPPSPVGPIRRLRGKSVGGFAHLAALVRTTRKEVAQDGGFVLLLDGGDLFSGTPIGNESRGDAVVDAMNALGYDAIAVGNHEFDYGLKNMLRLAERSRFPWLAANMSGRRRPFRQIKPYVVLVPPRVPCRVAVIGLITPSTPYITTPNLGDSVRFADPIGTTRSLLEQIDADLYILLTHLGYSEDRKLAEACPELALIVGGHSHTAMSSTTNGVRIVQTRGKGITLGRVTFDLDKKTWKVLDVRAGKTPIDPSATDPDPAVQRVIQDYEKNLGVKLQRVLGKLTAPLRRNRSFFTSTAGNWMSDVIRKAGGAQIGFMNKGGIRCDLEAGEISFEDIYRLMPFDNTIVSMDLTGAQVRGIARQALKPGRYPGLEWSGIEIEASKRGSGFEIVAIRVAGKPLEDKLTYRVATNSFVAAGGDGYAWFKQGRNTKKSGRLLRDVLAEALSADSPVTPPRDSRLLVVEKAR